MNAAVRSAVRVGIADGHKVFAVYDGFDGFAKGQVRFLGDPRNVGKSLPQAPNT
jgi:6-phosphofructokinase 1